MQRRRGDDEAAVAAHIEAGTEHVASGCPHVARVAIDHVPPAAAGGVGLHGERQVAVERLQVQQRVGALLAGAFVGVEHEDIGDRAGDDADAVGGGERAAGSEPDA